MAAACAGMATAMHLAALAASLAVVPAAPLAAATPWSALAACCWGPLPACKQVQAM